MHLRKLYQITLALVASLPHATWQLFVQSKDQPRRRLIRYTRIDFQWHLLTTCSCYKFNSLLVTETTISPHCSLRSLISLLKSILQLISLFVRLFIHWSMIHPYTHPFVYQLINPFIYIFHNLGIVSYNSDINTCLLLHAGSINFTLWVSTHKSMHRSTLVWEDWPGA